ncbi:hypothetical protein RIVM261_076990 [Rivularia sp. IAM M-261]|nr:hypothetical protein RIVM261_076990 [Rivularia sp. IAM M-261]
MARSIKSMSADVELIAEQRSLVFKQRIYRGMEDTELTRYLNTFLIPEGVIPGADQIPQVNSIYSDYSYLLEQIVRKDEVAHANASRKSLARPTTIAENIFNIWNCVFTGLEINFGEDGKIKVTNTSTSKKYDIENLSAGERSALYMIAKCLTASENKFIIVDESEQHLNPALLNKLWDEIESNRPDCTFIYISHDIEAIKSRTDCTLFWIKNFTYPSTWELEEINVEGIPKEVILQIIGSKTDKILFCEGTLNKDVRLYERAYPDFKVIPVGSCQNVIDYTKALNHPSRQDYHKEYFGLIDRDFRSKAELDALLTHKIFALPVAEIENIFFREEVIDVLFEALGKVDDKAQESKKKLREETIKKLSDDNFENAYFQYAIKQEFNCSLSTQKDLKKYTFTVDYAKINSNFQDLVEKKGASANAALEVLNYKGVKGLAQNIGFDYSELQEQILNLFNNKYADEIKKVLAEILPKIG